jgi:dihydroorotate dehydrogenase
MYKVLIRPLLFLISPERIHHLMVSTVRILHKIPLLPSIFRKLFVLNHPYLEREFIGLKFRNPVGLAAGFDKDAGFYNEFGNFGFGFIEIGTITPRPQSGNPKPRSFRLPRDKALINRMGLNNHGVDAAVKMLANRTPGLIIGGNIGKNTDTPDDKTAEDFVYCFEKLYDYVDYFVINISCPNTGEIDKLQDQEIMEAILTEIMSRKAKKQVKKPVLLKISPDLNEQQIEITLDLIEKLGIDGVVATNTTVKRNGLNSNPELIRKIGNGGLSGHPLKERSDEVIRFISHKTNGKLPVIGVGGIMSENDTLDKLDAGAGLIQVYSGFIYEGPFFVRRILKKLLKTKTLKY